MSSSPSSAWPSFPRHAVPTPGEVPAIAHEMRRMVLGGRRANVPLQTLSPLLRAARASVEHTRLDAASGGCEALLIPREGDRFAVLVDPTPNDGWSCQTGPARAETVRRRIRFRVMHELAHTLFYSRSAATPRRYGPETDEEERFCDHLAAAVLLPERVLAACETASNLVGLQRRYDVSVELAVRAWALTHQRDAALFFWTSDSPPAVQWATRPRGRAVRQWRNLLGSTATPPPAPPDASAHVVRERQQAVFLALA